MVSHGWGALGPVYLHTQSFLYWKHLQYMVIITTHTMVVIMGVPIIDSNLTSVNDQKVGGNDLHLDKALLMLNTDMFHFRYFVSYVF